MHSPTKKRRLSLPVNIDSAEAGVQSPKELSSLQELWKWTLTNDAIASCRVRDIFAMKDPESKGEWTLLWDITSLTK
jgi:hypothetical protein